MLTALQEPSTSERWMQARVPLSKILWDLDWSERLPYRLTDDDIVVRAGSYHECLPFIEQHYADLFDDRGASAFRAVSLSSAKERYYETAGDFFAFTHGEETVGLLVCTPVDWSTYYLRSAAVLREYQGRQLVARFFPYLFRLLSDAGVERVEADTSPANLVVVRILTRSGFNVTGSTLCDRWGAKVHMTKFLDEKRRDVFLDQFCSGVFYQRRPAEVVNVKKGVA